MEHQQQPPQQQQYLFHPFVVVPSSTQPSHILQQQIAPAASTTIGIVGQQQQPSAPPQPPQRQIYIIRNEPLPPRPPQLHQQQQTQQQPLLQPRLQQQQQQNLQRGEVNPPPRGLIHVSTVSGLPPRPPGPAAGANNNNNEGAGQGYVLSSPTMPTAPLSSQPSQKPVKKRATRRRATAAQQQLPLPPQPGDQRQQQQQVMLMMMNKGPAPRERHVQIDEDIDEEDLDAEEFNFDEEQQLEEEELVLEEEFEQDDDDVFFDDAERIRDGEAKWNSKKYGQFFDQVFLPNGKPVFAKIRCKRCGKEINTNSKHSIKRHSSQRCKIVSIYAAACLKRGNRKLPPAQEGHHQMATRRSNRLSSIKQQLGLVPATDPSINNTANDDAAAADTLMKVEDVPPPLHAMDMLQMKVENAIASADAAGGQEGQEGTEAAKPLEEGGGGATNAVPEEQNPQNQVVDVLFGKEPDVSTTTDEQQNPLADEQQQSTQEEEQQQQFDYQNEKAELDDQEHNKQQQQQEMPPSEQQQNAIMEEMPLDVEGGELLTDGDSEDHDGGGAIAVPDANARMTAVMEAVIQQGTEQQGNQNDSFEEQQNTIKNNNSKISNEKAASAAMKKGASAAATNTTTPLVIVPSGTPCTFGTMFERVVLHTGKRLDKVQCKLCDRKFWSSSRGLIRQHALSHQIMPDGSTPVYTPKPKSKKSSSTSPRKRANAAANDDMFHTSPSTSGCVIGIQQQRQQRMQQYPQQHPYNFQRAQQMQEEDKQQDRFSYFGNFVEGAVRDLHAQSPGLARQLMQTMYASIADYQMRSTVANVSMGRM